MNDQVNKPEFWAERLKEAGDDIRLSVYQCPDTMWEEINKAHKGVIEKLGITGNVLDAACGYGRISEWFEGYYMGLDISPEFIELARKKYPNKRFMLADITKGLPFPDGHFDWTICLSLRAMIIRELGKEQWEMNYLPELRRVSKKVLFLEYSDYDKYEVL